MRKLIPIEHNLPPKPKWMEEIIDVLNSNSYGITLSEIIKKSRYSKVKTLTALENLLVRGIVKEIAPNKFEIQASQ